MENFLFRLIDCKLFSRLPKLAVLLITVVLSLHTNAQIDDKLAPMAKALLSMNSKNYNKVLKTYMMNREIFDKHFKEEYNKLLGDDFELNLPSIYEGLDELNQAYADLPKLFASHGAQGKITFSHGTTLQVPLQEGQKQPNYNVALVFVDSKGQKFTWDFGQVLVIGEQIIFNPYGYWYPFDAVDVCGCLSDYAVVKQSMIGTFEGNCSVLNSVETLDGAVSICGLDWYDEQEDYYAQIDICECQKHWNDYEAMLRAALEISDVIDKQNRIAQVNQEFGEVLHHCKEKEEYLKAQEGFEGLESLLQDCNRD